MAMGAGLWGSVRKMMYRTEPQWQEPWNGRRVGVESLILLVAAMLSIILSGSHLCCSLEARCRRGWCLEGYCTSIIFLLASLSKKYSAIHLGRLGHCVKIGARLSCSRPADIGGDDKWDLPNVVKCTSATCDKCINHFLRHFIVY